jgi:hypothetical protein
MKEPVRLRRAVVAFGVSALLVAGCGGSGDTAKSVVQAGGDAFQLLSASSDATTDAGSARFSMEMAVEGGPQAMTITVDGAMDLEAPAATFSMDLAQMGVPGVDGKVEARLVDGTMYMDFGALADAPGFPKGVRWVSMDLEALAEQFGGDVSGLGSSDPTQFLGVLEGLRGISRDIDELGTEEVRGVETTEYRVVVDWDKALAEVPDELREQVGRAFEMFGGATMPMHVWVDDDGRLRRMSFAMSGADLAPGAGDFAMRLTMELYDFGAEVTVEAPPADETMDFVELFGAAALGAS